MFRASRLAAWMVAALPIVVMASGGSGGTGGSGGGGADASLSVRIPNELAPAGGAVQMKVLTTEVTPISGGRPGFSFDAGVFGGVAGFSIAAPGGEAAGAAVVSGTQVQIRYVTTAPFSDEYPILTIALPIRDDAVVGGQ